MKYVKIPGSDVRDFFSKKFVGTLNDEFFSKV